MPVHVSNNMCSSSGGQKLYYTASFVHQVSYLLR